VVSVEQRLFSRIFKLAGTVDYIGYNFDTNKFIIIDWKISDKLMSGRFSPLPAYRKKAYLLLLCGG
jgi:hypothetical protein